MTLGEMNRRIALYTFILLPLLAGIIGISAQPVNFVRYNGPITLLETEISDNLTILRGDLYRVEVLALVSGEGDFPLSRPNGTYNAVLVEGDNVTFLLEESVEVLDNVGLIGPFLVVTEGDVISSISLESEHTPYVELVEAKVGESATANIMGKEQTGIWNEQLGCWTFLLNWTDPGELAAVLIYRNNTVKSYSGLLKVNSQNMTFDMNEGPYSKVEVVYSDGEISLRAYDKPLTGIKEQDFIEIRGHLTFYRYGQDSRALIKVDHIGETDYSVIEPGTCETCQVRGISEYSLVSDENLTLDVGLEVPQEIIGGSNLSVSVSLGNGIENATILLPGDVLVQLKRDAFSTYRLLLPLTPSEIDRFENVYLTAYSSEGIFGIKKSLKILKSYEISLLNKSSIFLLGGKGDLYLSVYNIGSSRLFLSQAFLNVTSPRGDTISMKFPLEVELNSNRSQLILLPVNLPPGTYQAALQVLVVDSFGKTHAVTLKGITLRSIAESPLNALLTISPDLPNIGDKVTLKVTLSTFVPLDSLLVSVNVSKGLVPLSDTSKFLEDISGNFTHDLKFEFEARRAGSARVLVTITYSIKGESTKRSYTKEIKVPVGGVSGRASIELNKRKVEVGEKFVLVIDVQDVKGNVSVEFPHEMTIVESKGRIKGNRVEFSSPGRIEIVALFTEKGNYTLPTYISVNNSILIPVDAVSLAVVEKGSKVFLEKSLRSKLADLRRRYKTLKEASSEESISKKKILSLIEGELKEVEDLINRGSYEEASRLLTDIESKLSDLEEVAFSSIDRLMNSLIYFLIGIGVSLTLILLMKLRKGGR